MANRLFIYVNGDGDYQEHSQTTDGLRLADLQVGTVTAAPVNGIAVGGQINMGNNRITDVADPVDDQDAVNKRYLQNSLDGLDVKNSVRVATTGNIADLSTPPATIDGVTLVEGMRILVKDQADLTENGIYVVDSTGGLVRAEDADTALEFNANAFTFVEVGDTYEDTGWVVTTDITTLGVDDIVWTQFSSKGVVTAGDGLEYSSGTELQVDLLDANSGLKFVGATPNGELSIDFATSPYNQAFKPIAADVLNSTATGEGASIIGIEDDGGYFTGADVEAALQEIGADLESISFSTFVAEVDVGGVQVGDLLYFSDIQKVSAMPITTLHRAVGVAAADKTAGQLVTVLRQGYVTVSGIGSTEDLRFYWDGTTWTTTQPATAGSYVWQVGVSSGGADEAVVWPEFIKRNAV
jgi:hypothetical protein